MAPKKVMKVKKLGLEKLRKVMKAGKAKAKASSSKGALGKATSSKGALEKAKGKKLNKSNLEKFGQMSLKDKIAAACEEGDGLEAAAEILKGSLTKDEHSQASELWKKQDKWSTEKEMLAKFSEEELSMHLRQGKATASGLNMELGKVLSQLKVVLAGKGKAATDSKAVKKVLEESARVIKASKEEAKEL
ncbi:unnamed protein product, partial [Durusdinium trenchii]